MSGIGGAPLFQVENEEVSNNPSDQGGQIQRQMGTNVDRTPVDEHDLFADAVEPFWFNCVAGRQTTEETGTVLLDAANDLFALFVGAAAGIGGGGLSGAVSGPAGQIMDVLKTGRDVGETVSSFVSEDKLREMASRHRGLDKNYFTVSIGSGSPPGGSFVHVTNQTQIPHLETCGFVLDAMMRCSGV